MNSNWSEEKTIDFHLEKPTIDSSNVSNFPVLSDFGIGNLFGTKELNYDNAGHDNTPTYNFNIQIKNDNITFLPITINKPLNDNNNLINTNAIKEIEWQYKYGNRSTINTYQHTTNSITTSFSEMNSPPTEQNGSKNSYTIDTQSS